MLQIIKEIETIFTAAFAQLGLQHFAVNVTPATRTQFGDYQVNGVLAAAKACQAAPRPLAQQVLQAAQLPTELVGKAEIAGPGFINLWLNDQRLLRELNQLAQRQFNPFMPLHDTNGHLDAHPYTVVIDYSSPNLAKEMHVGHLRSTIIGDALVRLHQFVGHRVIKRNHVGDWGTQFGMLLAYMVEQQLLDQPTSDHAITDPNHHQHASCKLTMALSDLEAFYRQAKLRFDQDATFRETAHRMVVKLQHKEPAVYQLWQQFVAISMQHCQEIYRRLGVLLEPQDAVGESYYNEMLPAVVQDLVDAQIAVDDDGAKCIFFAPGELPLEDSGSSTPFIIQKRDGAYLYATTDLAAAYDRIDQLQADRLLYVIDARQSLHMQQLIATLRRRGKLNAKVIAEHIPFGVMLGEDGRPFKTRDGGVVHLAELLNEAERRAKQQLQLRHADWSSEKIDQIGASLAVAAIKYADLSKNRLSDYKFSFDQMLSWEGNTAPYLLYAYVRAKSIERKLQVDQSGTSPIAPQLDPTITPHPAERELIKNLLQWDGVLQQTIDHSLPHLLCTQLYQLASLFMRFYEQCPISNAASAVQCYRLSLIVLVATNLKLGLQLLGIEVIDEM